MKKNSKYSIIVLFLAGTIGFTSCTNKKEAEALKDKAQHLEQALAERDSAFNEIMEVMSTVETQMAQIKEQENMVALKSEGNFTGTEKDQIIRDMEAIDAMMQTSRQTIQNLSQKLDKADISINSFNKRVAELNKQLNQRTDAIAELKESLMAKDVQITSLTTEVQILEARVGLQLETIDLQMEKINEQHKDLNTAFFIIGSEKKLKTDGIVTKEGGFLWLGRTTELQDNVAREQFVEIDIQETNKFIIDSEKMTLVTEHPRDSYEVIRNSDKVEYINIKDPKRFWELSNYLVVTTKG